MSGHLVESFKATTTLAAYRVVAMVSGTANTVQYPEDIYRLALGVTIDDMGDTTDGVPVQMNGLAKLYFNDTVTTGALVGFDTTGRGVPFPAISNTLTGSLSLPVGCIGTLVGPKVDLTGTIALVSIQPQRLR
jgi:hypothetical protein